MNVLSLDYSMNYSTYCMDTESGIKFKSIIRNKKRTKKQNIVLQELKDTNIFDYVLIDEIEDDPILNIKDAEQIANYIIKDIKENNIEKVFIEGFSFNSIGRRVSDIYGYQYILRYLLYSNNILFEMYAPTTIKKTAGKGNFNKLQMIEKFLEIENINLNKLKQIYKKYNSKNIIKPLDDIVDSYWIMQTYLTKIN